MWKLERMSDVSWHISYVRKYYIVGLITGPIAYSFSKKDIVPFLFVFIYLFRYRPTFTAGVFVK